MEVITPPKRHIYKHQTDPLWHVQLAVLVALLLQFTLPERLVFGPHWVLPLIEGLLLGGLTATTPKVHRVATLPRRIMAMIMICLTSLANATSLFLLAGYLLKGGQAEGKTLIISAVNIFVTNIIVFGLWYWELDGGGPGQRHSDDKHLPDFMFPQLDAAQCAPSNWIPTFVDYVYVSSTNAMAFSPTDTLPLTHRAKLLMLFQALVSLITIALVASRAVNILS